ncbi:hypothetical protein HPULCUR_004791 [Helicostylum pulchrum]|uniref:Uncharacterized protein n=1 Tax=Helicostylum pulchrum TaxID=562976 RepID=A0ABP9XX77_9FUNG
MFLTYVVPITAKERFQLLVDFQGLRDISIAIKPIVKLDIDTSVIDTPGYFERHVQVLKDDAKLHMYFTDRSPVRYKYN